MSDEWRYRLKWLMSKFWLGVAEWALLKVHCKWCESGSISYYTEDALEAVRSARELVP